MKPINIKSENCESQSSNCVVWDGPKIECINLCPGDSVTDIVYNLAKELCTIKDQLNLTSYDLKCLTLSEGNSANFQDLVQAIINQLCLGNSQLLASEDISSPTAFRTTSSQGCPDCEIFLPPCFQYTDPSNGDIITTGKLADVTSLILLRVCTLVSQIFVNTEALNVAIGRINVLENQDIPTYQLPSLTPTCITGNNLPVQLDDFVSLLERSFCELRTATGGTTALYRGVGTGDGLNTASRLGTGGGNLSSIEGWQSDVTNLSDSFGNMWLAIRDLRSAVFNIKLNCCNSLCDGIEFNMVATFTQPGALNLFFTGNIPANLENCINTGTLLKITDQSGNEIRTSVDIKLFMNNPVGFSLSLQGTPLVQTDDFTISGAMCFTDAETGSVCQQNVSYVVVNTIACPNVTYTTTATTINYSFTSLSGVNNYTLQIFDAQNNIIASQTVTTNSVQNVTGILTGLGANTIYRVRVQINNINNTKTCPFTVVTTEGSACGAPNVITAIITIP